jgi:hypothetical protein
MITFIFSYILYIDPRDKVPVRVVGVELMEGYFIDREGNVTRTQTLVSGKRKLQV